MRPAPFRQLLIRAASASLCLWLCACNLQDNRALSNQPPTALPAGPPRIEIISPAEGAEFVIGEEILVSVAASDSIGVNRAQLFVNGQIARTVSSESPQGELEMEAILNYRPRRADVGEIRLRAVAYRGLAVSEPAEIAVFLRETRSQIIATPAPGSGVPYIPDDGLCRALVNVPLNFRAGPGTGYQIITVLASGTLAPITGRNGAGGWWRLNVDNRVGWVSGDYTSEFGDCGPVPVVG